MEEITSAILESDIEKLNNLLNKVEILKLSGSDVKELIKLSKDKGVLKVEATILLKYKTELNSYSDEEKERSIIALIKELSEDFYCSGWNDGIEKELWYWGNGISEPHQIFKKGVIKSNAKLAVNFGKEIGLWTEWNNNENKPKAISIEDWNKKLNI
ncbi:hypothetical protein [Aquimarina sp. SS2-1]|uniref:hypothetical protein n=1 Tax=Aquimarina besae TaxID=3342247 RepID=UPI00366C5492